MFIKNVLHKLRVGLAGDLCNLVHTFYQHFTETPLFIFKKNTGFYYLYSSHLSIFLSW